MSPNEIVIFNTLTEHQKFLYLKAALQAYNYAEWHYSQPVRNRKGDAVKHSFWNALSTVYLGQSLTSQLTTAHEQITYDPDYGNHYKETEMDLFNNSKGRELANLSGRLYQLVEQAVENGNLKYLSNLSFNGVFYEATGNSELIPTNN